MLITKEIAKIFFDDSPYAVFWADIQGNLLYQNPVSEKTWVTQSSGSGEAGSIQERLAVSSDWDAIIEQIEEHQFSAEFPLLIHTRSGQVATGYLTAMGMWSATGELEAVLGMFSARRKIAHESPDNLEENTSSDVHRKLTTIIEDRAFEAIVMSRRFHDISAILETLSVGVLLANDTGEIEYVNPALEDTFGFAPSTYPKLNVKYILSDEALAHFRDVVRTGKRSYIPSEDMRGASVEITLLPIQFEKGGRFVVLQFALPAEVSLMSSV